MNPELLKCKPIRYLCPFCGKWHEWTGHELKFQPMELKCLETNCIENKCYYTICFDDKYAHFSIGCVRRKLIDSIIPINSIIESINRPFVIFNVTYETLNMEEQNICGRLKGKCNLSKLDEKIDKNIKLGFEFHKLDYNQFSKASILARKEKELKEREKAIAIKEQSLKECEQTINKI